jgi:WXG100 family type VII secretion target
MSNNGVIAYNFAGLDTLSGDLKSQFAKLGALADELKTQVNKLGANWQSQEGAASYQAAQNTWDIAFADVRTQLNGLGSGVENAGVMMRNADRRVRDSFA